MDSLKKLLCIALISSPLLVEAADEQELGAHAASCSAYFFSAANAKGVADYEVNYGGGEYTFNIAVSAIGNQAALEHFNGSSERINDLMQKRWSDFYKVDEEYADQCSALKQAYLKVRDEKSN